MEHGNAVQSAPGSVSISDSVLMMVGNVYEAHEKKKKKFTTCSDHKATSLAPLFNSWTETHALKGRGRSDQQSGVGKMRNFFFTFPVESANRP